MDPMNATPSDPSAGDGDQASSMDAFVAMERAREGYWLRYPATSPTRLRWRALTTRHWLHILPGESILEVGAGGGLWTEHLGAVLRHENPITAAVFNPDLAEGARHRQLANVSVQLVDDLVESFPPESFDYVVGTAILCHDRYAEALALLHRLLKPGGRLLFFEANFWNPQVLLKSTVPAVGRRFGHTPHQIGMRRFELMQVLSRKGYVDIDIVPYDILHPKAPRALVGALQSLAFVLEHAPVAKELCGTLYISAQKPGDETRRRPAVQLTPHTQLHRSTSVVVPCRNEAMNIPSLASALTDHYDDYLAEIIFVNDCSTDDTAEVVRQLARHDARIRLVDRTPPGGVGRALGDGYAATTGRFVLSMDCDFRLIVPELRDLFDVVAGGASGAIGSRFSHESILVNYPFAKILANRGFHLLARLVLHRPLRDISNNLKLYRGDILRDLVLTRPDFAANVETGLRPLLAGHDIREVPVSWINRGDDMGASSFRLARLAPSYVASLGSVLKRAAS
jgi:dolichol-phosphate mannosyltransferase